MIEQLTGFVRANDHVDLGQLVENLTTSPYDKRAAAESYLEDEAALQERFGAIVAARGIAGQIRVNGYRTPGTFDLTVSEAISLDEPNATERTGLQAYPYVRCMVMRRRTSPGFRRIRETLTPTSLGFYLTSLTISDLLASDSVMKSHVTNYEHNVGVVERPSINWLHAGSIVTTPDVLGGQELFGNFLQDIEART